MIALSCADISYSIGSRIIIDRITFKLEKQQKACLTGVNGAGKSTLFKIITGRINLDSGNIFIAKGITMGMLEQDSGLISSNTIMNELESVFSEQIQIEKKLEMLQTKISTESQKDNLDKLLQEYADLNDVFEKSEGYLYRSKINGVLNGLGLTGINSDTVVSTMSGGEKTRLALARLLLQKPDLLLLDEPTNHLDIKSVEWLENFLKGYDKTLFIISHDRYFLDEVTDTTFELENTKIYSYKGNYTEFVRQKQNNRALQQKKYEDQQKEIKRIESIIEQQKRWNRERNIIAAESRQKALDRMVKLEKPQDMPQNIKLHFKKGIVSGNDVLSVKNLSKSYPGKTLFDNISFEIQKNEVVFIIGANGTGKSTLLKILSSKFHQDLGEYEYGHKVIPAYFDQEHRELDETLTIIDDLWATFDNISETELRTTLAMFLFTGEDINKKISVLSGGEKSRLSFVKLLLTKSNFLMLDEPTNHLDVNSREMLEKALTEYTGTILAISHDRYFINKLASRIIELKDGKIFDFKGNYSQFHDYIKNKNMEKADLVEGDTLSASKIIHMENKERKARQKKLEREIQNIEKLIEENEVLLKSIEREMTSANQHDHILLSELYNKKINIEELLENLYKQWDILI